MLNFIDLNVLIYLYLNEGFDVIVNIDFSFVINIMYKWYDYGYFCNYFVIYCNLGWLDNINFYKFLLGLKKE